MKDSRPETLEHIRRVQTLMSEVIERLMLRAIAHDKSKLESPEKEYFDKAGKLSGLTYGSEEYKAALDAIRPGISHHYEHNSHHPEHHNQGVNGMTLLDVVEMLCDWKAAGERHDDGCIHKSIEHNKDRFNISPQLIDILHNTRIEMGWYVREEEKPQ